MGSDDDRDCMITLRSPKRACMQESIKTDGNVVRQQGDHKTKFVVLFGGCGTWLFGLRGQITSDITRSAEIFGHFY